MNKSWCSQVIKRVVTWNAHYWLAEQYADIITPSVESLSHRFDNPLRSFKHDKTTSVALIREGHTEFVLKRYNARSRGHKFKRALRRSRARRCWLMSYEFANAKLNVASPILMYEQRCGLIRKDTYFANEYLDGEELLSALPKMDKLNQQSVVKAVKQAMDSMREHRITHGDMKASNLLWREGCLYFIDLDAATTHRANIMWQRAHKRDRKRFLKNWRDQPELLALFSWMK